MQDHCVHVKVIGQPVATHGPCGLRLLCVLDCLIHVLLGIFLPLHSHHMSHHRSCGIVGTAIIPDFT